MYQELNSSGRRARPKSTPPMGYMDHDQRHPSQSSDRAGSWGNLATSGESTRNQETGYGYRDSQNYPSLKRGMGVRRYVTAGSGVLRRKDGTSKCKRVV